jgi:hypothetical protein
MKKVVRNEITSKEKKRCFSVIQIIDFSSYEVTTFKTRLKMLVQKITITFDPKLILYFLF